ncbi:MAG: M13 family metallopeptidase [Bacilli bacterium]|nr:M13 family metallopeptidase [Bacilli bacterium]
MSNIRIQDDLYEFVNHDWLEQAVIPEDKPTAGGFADLALGVEELLIGDLNKMCEEGNYPDSYLENACKLYNAIKDVKRRKKDGIRPALKRLSKIEKLKTIAVFNRRLPELLLEGYPLPFRLSVETDMKDTDKHCILITGPSTILPDVTYYKNEQQKAAMIGLWSQMAAALLSKTKLTPEQQALYLADCLKFDELLAGLVKSSQEWSEYAKMYNPMKIGRVNAMVKPVKLKKLCETLLGEIPETIIVAEPRYFKGFKDVFNLETFELYKHWAYVTELIDNSHYLSEELRELGGTYGRALMGIAAMASPEKFAYNAVSGLFSEPIGLYYGRTYFGEEAKKDITSMAKDIIGQYKVRLQGNAILSPETKEKAVIKLSAIQVKMGYPDKVQAIYDKFIVDDTLPVLDIVYGLRKIRTLDAIAEYKEPVDHSRWAMPGHMVNACYDPFTNDITFPAAILQAPFYSIKQSRSQNLGGIGAVIGHEISHAFDNNGALFDEHGNLKDWWTKEDFKRFKASTKAMIKEFEGIELPWGKVNSELIVSENIADNGGMAVTIDLVEKAHGNFEEYFINWAKVWCQKAKPEYRALLLSVDVHAPTVLRANMQPRNFPQWYETFGVTKKDQMYLAPNKRVIIW